MKTRCPADEFYMKPYPVVFSPVIQKLHDVGFIQEKRPEHSGRFSLSRNFIKNHF